MAAPKRKKSLMLIKLKKLCFFNKNKLIKKFKNKQIIKNITDLVI